jgi:hypothetical protein
MSEQKDPIMTREDINMQWAFTFLQEMRQDIRDVNRRLDDLSHRMDQRFNRQTATMLGIAGAIIAAIKL